MKKQNKKTAITPTREEFYAEWYQNVVKAADLAETSPVRGCMIIKPWGYAIWENVQRILDDKFKATGHSNAYFPLFIPLSYLEKEASHVEGFAKECAVVTHHRLVKDEQSGGLKPAGELEEPLVVRPTSETIIGEAFSRWVQSYRDLPLLINQWANVVRWEMRTRLFLRTTEFLWQEGHTAHSTSKEAVEETLKMVDVYSDFAEQWLAMPVIKGEKTESERFPGAVQTYCIEAMMQDHKALQAGTCHFLGQNFAKASNITFLDSEGQQQLAWTTSWGVSTRLLGGMIMTHSDDNGLVLPPKIAPTHVVIIPIIHKQEVEQEVMSYCQDIAQQLRAKTYDGRAIQVHIDNRDLRSGEKSWEWIKKGVPIKIEVGPRDIADNAVFCARRDQEPQNKQNLPKQDFIDNITDTLDSIQNALFERAKQFRDQRIVKIDSKEDFYKYFTAPPVPENDPTPIHAGFALTHFCGDGEVEAKIKEDLGVTVRCIPFDRSESGTCPFSGKPSAQRVIWAKSY